MTVEESLEVVGECRCRGVSQGRLFLKAFTDDGFDICMNVGLELPDVWSGAMHDMHHRLHDGVGLEGWFTGQESKENSTHCIDVGCDPLRFAFTQGLFGGHVAWGPECCTGGGEPLFGPDLFSETEVGNNNVVEFIDQDVGGFQVSVNNAVLVSVMDGAGNIADVPNGLFHFEGA